MQTILVVFHIFLAVGLIGLILIQHGKGADMGAAFGSGASGTVFGSKGSASFLTRLTAGLATLFFVTSMVMAYFATQRDDGNSVLDALQEPAAEVEMQPQTDLPPMPGASDMPANGGDIPVVPAADGETQAVPASDLPMVAAPENSEQPASVEASTEDQAAVKPAATAPQEESKE